jgi:NAD(P)-dependent dehydrogenase (short-subunit alcohol dehydrogenase family)
MDTAQMFSLKGKTAIVVGATGLIGPKHCLALLEAGANVVAADIDGPKLEGLVREFEGRITPYVVNITSKVEIEGLRDFALQKFSTIDILVNNAAINDSVENPKSAFEDSKFENYEADFFRKMMDVNILGTVLTCQVIGTQMAKQGKGSIINVASTYGVVAPDQSLYRTPAGEQKFFKGAAYPVTKAGVLSLTRFLATYWGTSGVRVNALSPGGVENGQDPFFIENYSKKTPLGRMANASDFKGAIVYLASEASAYMTGHNLLVDGGWTVW